MNSIIKNRSEILFLFDIKDANPNGDPLDENKPRIDEETGLNIVTDVRLKRTIRDYLINFKGYDGSEDKDIFIREICYDQEKGYIQDGKMRAKDKDNNPAKIITECIDVRLFGGVIPLKEDSITYTGPVQFKMGRSLHKVVMKHIKGTGAFASGEGQKQATFREEDVLYYSLISFYGIINENAAKHTKLTDEDVKLLLEGIWEGTKNLISRTKIGQTPRLLMKVNYKEDNYHIGDLDKMIELKSNIPDEKLRDIEDIKIDVSKLVSSLETNKNNIESIDLKINERVHFIKDNTEFDIKNIAGILINDIKF